MSVIASYPLMEGTRETLLRPGSKFRGLDPCERARLAAIFLDLFDRLRRSHKDVPHVGVSVRDLISWVDTGDDIVRGMRVWRRELFNAQNAARSAVAMGQGRPALDLAGGPGCEVAPLHLELATPCQPLPSSEIAL